MSAQAVTKPLRRIGPLNPNTSTTEAMLTIARDAVGTVIGIEGRTAPLGAPLITTEALLADAAKVLAKIGSEIATEGFDAIVIGGFGDPGLEALRSLVGIPVTGIAEASMADAGVGEALLRRYHHAGSGANRFAPRRYATGMRTDWFPFASRTETRSVSCPMRSAWKARCLRLAHKLSRTVPSRLCRCP